MAGMGVGGQLCKDGPEGMEEEEGFSLGGGRVEVLGGAVKLAGTNTLAGRYSLFLLSTQLSLSLSHSVTSMDECIRHFKRATACTDAAALEAASHRPAQVLGLQEDRGRLVPGARADLVLIDSDLHIQATFIAGQLVWCLHGNSIHKQQQIFLQNF